MHLYLTPMEVGDVTLVEASGRITLGQEVAALRQVLEDLNAKGRRKIVLNLAGVSYIDSSGIAELVSGFTAAKRNGGTLKLLKLTKRVQDLLQITKLSTVFEIFDDESKAIASFAGSEGAATSAP